MDSEYPIIPQEQAAVGQLHTAIRLYFQEADIPSIHTLAAAAQGILENVARERNVKLTAFATEIIKTKPQWFGKLMRDPQNYFKHGNPKLKKGYHPNHPEVLIMDSIVSCSELFGGRITPLMTTFLAYIGVRKTPEILSDQVTTELLKGGKLEELACLKRKDFFNRMLPIFTAAGAAHIDLP